MRSTTVTVRASQLGMARHAFIRAGGTITVCAPVTVDTEHGRTAGYMVTAVVR